MKKIKVIVHCALHFVLLAISKGNESNLRNLHLGGGIELIKIPAGKFMMGSPPHEEGRRSDEGPVEVELDSFYMAKSEISWRNWIAVAGKDATEKALNRAIKDDELDLPVTGISYYDALTFCALLSTQLRGHAVLNTGIVTLPSESQWEYSAAGQNNQRGPIPGKKENVHAVQDGNFKLWPVDRGDPNSFGLVGMFGNVSEYCRDAYTPHIAGGRNFVNVGVNDITLLKVSVRGGSLSKPIEYSRTSRRNYVSPNFRGSEIGFRVVVDFSKDPLRSKP